MNPLKRLEHELAGFLLFGGMMTAELRKLTAELLFRFLFESHFDAKAALHASEIPKKHPHWAQLLEKLFEQEDLKKLTRLNEDFAMSVTKEALEWCKKTYKSFEQQSPLFDEVYKLSHMRDNLKALPNTNWKTLLKDLKESYSQHVRAWDFYEQRLDKLEEEPEPAEASQNILPYEEHILKQNVLDDWEKWLQRKRLEVESAFLAKSFDRYYQSLSQKVDKLNGLGQQLFPYYNFLGMSWNASIENWNKIAWDKLEDYAHTLQEDRELRELAELLGRFHVNATYMKEQALLRQESAPEWKPNPYGKSEIVGITQSDQLSALLPSEIALLSQPETEIIFDKKFIEKKLLTFQYRSHDLSNTREEEEIVSIQAESTEKGPIILCIDTSGSMFGQPERVAKALAFAILEIALRDERQAFLISFSNAIQCIEMTGIEEDISRMIDFLKMSFHGSTDLQPALKKSVEMIQEETFKHADVLVISDFVIPRLSRRMLDLLQQCREEQGTHFHSLYITRRPDSQAKPLTLFDHHWVYDLNNPRVIRQALMQLGNI